MLTFIPPFSPIRNLSDGQKCRVAFAWVAWQNPHMLMLDEPTNHLDLESIDALADAIKKFNGGMILVSHDFRLISQVANEIWICENQTATKWTESIVEYKNVLKANVLGEDGKKKDMAAASADHYNKKENPALPTKTKAPSKPMGFSLGNAGKVGGSKNSSMEKGKGSPKAAKGKFVPPGKRAAAEKATTNGKGDSEDWW